MGTRWMNRKRMEKEIWYRPRSALSPYKDIQPGVCSNIVRDIRILKANPIGQSFMTSQPDTESPALSPSPKNWWHYNFMVKLTYETEPTGHLWPKPQPWSDVGWWCVFSPAPTSSSLLLYIQWGPAVSNFLPPTAGRWFSAVSCHLFQLCVLIIAFVLMVFFRKKKKIRAFVL